MWRDICEESIEGVIHISIFTKVATINMNTYLNSTQIIVGTLETIHSSPTEITISVGGDIVFYRCQTHIPIYHFNSRTFDIYISLN